MTNNSSNGTNTNGTMSGFDAHFQAMKKSFQTYQEVPLAIILVIGLVANSMIIINGIRRRKQIKHYSNYFVLNMAVADWCVVFFTIPMMYVEYLSGLLWMSNFVCSHIIQIRETFQGVAIVSISTLAVLRVRQVMSDPLGQFSKRTCRLIVAAIWLICFLVCTVPFFDIYEIKPYRTCDPDWPSELRTKVHMTLIVCVLLSPMVVATIAYGIILFKVTDTLRSDAESESVKNKNRSIAVLLFMLILSAWISYSPLGIFLLVDVYVENPEYTNLHWNVVTLLYLGGSALNPVLVLLTMPKDYRFNMQQCCQCKRPRRVGVEQKVVLQSTIALHNRNGIRRELPST